MGENALKEPTIKERGRFRYIEPNDVLENNRYSKSGTDESFNITSPYEDYCIDVELEVKIPNRGVWVADLSGNSKVGVTSNEGKTVSFFSGDDSGFLSDTPASLIYKDLLSGKQDRESLGITNIHVTYNSHFIPEVTIKFTDIRGMGLMMPHEEVYRQEHTIKKDTPKIEKFFAALFTFPYPEFLLRIKGFYGKKVEYSLVVSDFKSSFNNQTGNFEATVKFIGKMYGMYTDIPMAYLLVAPYCTYGSINNKTIWDQKQFTFPGTNTPIPKLLDLKTMLIEGVKETKEIIAKSIDANLEKVYQKNNSLNGIINDYNNFKRHITKSQDISKNIITDDNIFLFADKTEYNGSARYAYSYLYPENDNKLITLTDNLYKSITNFNNEYMCHLSYIGGLPQNIKIGEKENYLAFISHNEDGTITITCDDENVKFNVDDFPTLKDKLKYALPKAKSETFYIVNAIKFNEGINKLQEAISKTIQEAEEYKNEEANVAIEKVLKFKPSIKNMFTILMAHLQTFMEIFHACIKEINDNDSRTIKGRGLTLNNLPDIPSYISLDSQLPPFPAFKKTLNNELCYPNDAGIKGGMEETSLINQMFIGCGALLNEVAKSDAILDNIQTPSQEKFFIPTCITDYNCYIDNGSYLESNNPYFVLSRAPESKMHWVWFYFAMRCIQKFIMERGDDLKPENFGAYEAYNLWLAMPKMDETTLNALTSADNGFTKFMEYLTKKEKKCYELWDGYTLLHEKDGMISPMRYVDNNNKPSMPHIPARIGHDSTDCYKQFREDAYEQEAPFAFKYATENHSAQDLATNWGEITVRQGHRPYGLMQEIPFENLKKWDEAIKNYSNIPNNYNDHTELVSKQIERNEGYYYNNKDNRLGGDNSSNTNPAWNVMCQKGTGGEFFQYINNSMPETYKDSLCTLDDILASSEKLQIHNIRRVDEAAKQCPLFLLKPGSLRNNPERFLCPIPHNFERIINDLCVGKKIVHIPYATKLFIGFIIDKFNTLKDDEINDFINSIVDKCGGSYEKWYGGDKPNYKIEGVLGNQRSGSLAQMLLLLAGFFSTNNEGNIITPWTQNNKITYPILSLVPHNQPISCDMIGHSIKAMREAGFFKNDTFGFVEEYKRWFKDETEGGFQWFVNTMCLDMNKTVNTKLIGKGGNRNDFKYTRNDKETLLTTLKDFLNKKEVYENLEFLQEKNPGTPKKACSNTENALNLLFKEENGKSFSRIYRGVYCHGRKGDVENVYLRFNDEYIGVQELEKFLSKVVYFIAPYTLCAEPMSNPPKQTLQSTSDKFKNAFNSFITSLRSLYDIKIEGDNNESAESSQTNVNGRIPVTNERKFAMYITLKNLYDKHLTNINDEISKFDIQHKKDETRKNDREIDRFHFIDTYYRDISDKLLINPDTVVSIIDDITHGYRTGVGEGVLSSEMSLYSFMGLLCQRHNMMLMSVPVFNGTHLEFNHDNLKKMFTPIPHSNAKNGNVLHGPSYICFYPHKTSQHLNIPISLYQDDGFLIENDDVNDTANFEGASTIFELMEDGDYTIPAFGVEYGSQKQSIFKNINVNMDNPQTTEVAVATMFSIANNGEDGSKRLIGIGQDLYQIYSNYSYTCQVEMMGCAQIQPLMYFQLNNVPMFRGAYQIIHVEHDIVPGNMTTTFKGVRINKNIMPMVSNFVTIKLDDVISKKGATYSSPPSSKFTYMPLDKTKVHSQSMDKHTLSQVTADTLLDDEVLKKHVMFPDNNSQYPNLHNNVKIAFNRLCPTVRQFVYCLVKDLSEMSKELGYTIGIYINSAAREGAINGSYHRTVIDSSDSNFRLRNAVNGTKVSDDGTGFIEEIPYSSMACAIDIIGLVMDTSPSKDGLYRGDILSGHSKGASVQIFHHIVDNYYMYIKELIWEIHGSTKPTDTKIDILHFASIGECSATNEGYVLMSSVTYTNGQSNTKKIKGDRNTFCPSFNEACDKIKTKNTYLKTTSYT